MVENNLLVEVKSIFETGIRSKAVMTPIGYKELFPYFENKKTLNECLEEMKKNSRHYAKRQYTFFNHQFDTHWVSVDFNNFNNTIEEVLDYIKK